MVSKNLKETKTKRYGLSAQAKKHQQIAGIPAEKSLEDSESLNSSEKRVRKTFSEDDSNTCSQDRAELLNKLSLC